MTRNRSSVTSPGLIALPGAANKDLIVAGYVPHNADAPSRNAIDTAASGGEALTAPEESERIAGSIRRDGLDTVVVNEVRS